MTVYEIQMRLYQQSTGCSWMAPNIFLFDPFESDFIEVTKSGYIREYEIKMSLSDFYNDSKKTHWNGKSKYELLLDGKLSAEFNYVFPHGLIPFDKIPDWAGIIQARNFNQDGRKYVVLTRERAPKKLHKNKITNSQIQTLCTSLHYRYWELQRRRIKEKQGQILML